MSTHSSLEGDFAEQTFTYLAPTTVQTTTDSEEAIGNLDSRETERQIKRKELKLPAVDLRRRELVEASTRLLTSGVVTLVCPNKIMSFYK